jgi:hypothetical protein
MLYHDGSEVMLDHIISVPIPSGMGKGRVVMLGDTYEHLDIDPRFVEWVTEGNILKPYQIVIEWVGDNPFAHNDLRYAPVGRYMFTPLDEFVIRVD